MTWGDASTCRSVAFSFATISFGVSLGTHRPYHSEAKKQSFHGVRFDGKTYDTGSKVGFLAANVAFAMSRPDIWPGFKAELKKIVGEI